MARIVLADDGIVFDGDTPKQRPLGGVESSIVNLTRELAARGHEVIVRNMCERARIIDGVDWAPLKDGLPDTADLYIANRGDKLIPLLPTAKHCAFWIHNPARYLMKWRYLSKLWRRKPTIVFIGTYHATTYPAWAPGGARKVIPYGIASEFTGLPQRAVPGPKAIFTSNPLRSLDWLLDQWESAIHPRVPNAQLHLFTGAATYGSVGDAKAQEMAAILAKAKGLTHLGVVLRDPVAKHRLIEEFQSSRVMLYRGDLNETFCLAVGEAQAAGVPAVVGRYGSVVERVIDGETGTIADSDALFADAAVKFLTDDTLWAKSHKAALEKQGRWGWTQAAQAFEELIA